MNQPRNGHMPAPWGYRADSGEIFYADGDVEPHIAFVSFENASEEQAEADARLIVEAPEMADLIRDFVTPGVMISAERIERGRAILARIEGEG